jgi:hypothetical protein
MVSQRNPQKTDRSGTEHHRRRQRPRRPYYRIPRSGLVQFRLCARVHKRKNYLFAGSDAGGEPAAAMYSLIGSAKLNGVEPEGYLSQVLGRIADHPIDRIGELLPWNLGPPPDQPAWA